MFTKKQGSLLAAALASAILCGSAFAGTTASNFAVSVAIASKCSIGASPALGAWSVTCTAGSTAPTIKIAGSYPEKVTLTVMF